MANFSDKLALLITADGRGAITELKKVGTTAERELGKAQKSSERWSKTFTKAGVGLVAGSAVAAAGLYKLGQAASDLNESQNKVSVVFGKSGKAILDWSKTAATAFGQSQQEALEAAGTFGNLFRAIGLGVQPAAKMSTSLVQLAGDLASFNNADPSEVLLALRSGLVGEVEPLRKFGVSLSAARIEQEALNSGLAKSKDAITPAAKAQAAYRLILQDTSLAQGDFARTSNGAANQQRILSAQFKDLQANIGTGVLPALNKLLSVGEKVGGAFEHLSPEAKKTVGTFATFATGGAAVVGTLSLIAGQAAKLASRFTDAEGQITKFGRAAQGVGIATAVAGSVFALKALNDETNRLKINIDDLTRSSTRRLISEFSKFRELDDSGLVNTSQSLRVFREIADQSIGTAQRLRDGLAKDGVATGEYDKILRAAAAGQRQANADVEAGSKVVERHAAAHHTAAKAVGKTVDELKKEAEAAKEADQALRAQADSVLGLADAQLGLQQQQLSLNQAEADYAKALDEVKKGGKDTADKMRDLADAELNVKQEALGVVSQAQRVAEQFAGVAGGSLKAEQQISVMKDTLVDLARNHPELAAFLNGLIAQLDALTGRAVQSAAALHRVSSAGEAAGTGGIRFRAAGGPLRRGDVAVVGERGPEVFVPTSDGVVIPNHKLRFAASGAGSLADIRASLRADLRGALFATGGPNEAEINRLVRLLGKKMVNELASEISNRGLSPVAQAIKDRQDQIAARQQNLIDVRAKNLERFQGAIGAALSNRGSLADFNTARTSLSGDDRLKALLDRVQSQQDFETAVSGLTKGGRKQFEALAARAGLTRQEIGALESTLPSAGGRTRGSAGGVNVTVNVQGTVTAERDLARTITDEVIRRTRRGHASIVS